MAHDLETAHQVDAFESFNARALPAELVAQRFVPPDAYRELVKRRHTIVLGPRGSGKTTLLKMLQPRALAAWGGDDGRKARRSIDFTGVFIPSDAVWQQQLKSFNDLQIPERLARALSRSAFTLHALRAIVEAMRMRTAADAERMFKPVALDRSTETQICRELSKVWRLTEQLPSLQTLQHALSDAVTAVAGIALEEDLLGSKGRRARLEQHGFLHLPLVPSVISAIERFNDAAGEPEGRWALLFDEMELAPAPVFEEALGSVRGGDQRLLLKIALTPITEAAHLYSSAIDAMPQNDYDLVRLFGSNKDANRHFAHRLTTAMMESRRLPRTRAVALLGFSPSDLTKDTKKGPDVKYVPGSPVERALDQLRGQDPSFQKYLDRSRIRLEELDKLDGRRRAATLRKVAPVAPIRLAFRPPTRDERPKVRNAYSMYTGANALYDAFEGNPRVVIAAMGELLDRARSGRPVPTPKNPLIPKPAQADVLARVTSRFQAMIRVVPIPAIPGRGGVMTLLDVIDLIGAYMHRAVVTGPFTPDPPGTFVVDDGVEGDLRKALQDAATAGAIVHITRKGDQEVPGTLVGRRFRLSYALAPAYRVPQRLGRAVNLTTILRDYKELEIFQRRLYQ